MKPANHGAALAKHKPKKQKNAISCEYCGIATTQYGKYQSCPLCKKVLCFFHHKPEKHRCEKVDWDTHSEEMCAKSKELFEKYKEELRYKKLMRGVGKILLVILILGLLYVMIQFVEMNVLYIIGLSLFAFILICIVLDILKNDKFKPEKT